MSFLDDFRYAWATIVALCSQGLNVNFRTLHLLSWNYWISFLTPKSVSNQTLQVSNQTPQISNQYAQESNQYAQESNQSAQVSNQYAQTSNQQPQVSDQGGTGYETDASYTGDDTGYAAGDSYRRR